MIEFKQNIYHYYIINIIAITETYLSHRCSTALIATIAMVE